ncbi:MAG: hypothetical protein E6R12_13055 [Sphingomonadales bacterium]|nr:MAG: hypothetical protein E6R12_13055 [Sphingomonadales bacterium]
MAGLIFDTNILIDFLRGIEPARVLIDTTPDRAISMISWMEVLCGAGPDRDAATRNFLAAC